jgi:hypothetical protein
MQTFDYLGLVDPDAFQFNDEKIKRLYDRARAAASVLYDKTPSAVSPDVRLDYCTHGDGQSFINIGTTAQTALGKLLCWYDVRPRQTVDDQLTFYMYAGLYFYYITEGDNQRFLRARSRQELEAKKKYRWANVKGLEHHLASELLYNLQQQPFTKHLLLNNTLPIDWIEPDRPLTTAEKRWLRVVQDTVRRLRNDLRS